jgi:iron(III) transport system substrate-binding protein
MTKAFAATALLLALAASVQAAEPKTVAEVADYRGADRQAVFEAGAKKEGALLVYTIGTQSDPMLEVYQKKYPSVRLEIFRAPTPELTRRVFEEYKADKKIVDVLDMSTGGLQQMREASFLQTYYTPEMSAYPASAMEASKLWVFDYEAFVSLGFNTDAVSVADSPKTYDDLLNPKWKGKMAVSDNGSTLPHWVGGVLVTKGEDYLKKLGQQDVKVFNVLGRALSNLVVSGEVPMSPVIYNSHMRNSKGKGAHVDWHALGPVYSNVNALALAKGAPHPFASMLYIDYTLSHEGQALRVQIGDDSARNELAAPEKPKEILYLTERPDYAREYEQWTELSKRIFGKGRAPDGK